MNSNPSKKQLTRRQVVAGGAVGGSLVALAGGGGYVLSRSASHAESNSASDLPASWQYDIEALKHIDPALIHYEPANPINTGLKQAVSLSFSADGQLHLIGDRKLISIDSAGQIAELLRSDQPLTALHVSQSLGILVGLTDRWAVVDLANQRLDVRPSLGDRAVITGITSLGEQVLIADSGQRVIGVCDAQGNVDGQIGRRQPERGVEGLVAPSPCIKVRAATDRTIWVNNPGKHRLEQFDLTGEPLGYFGKATNAVEGFGGCCNPVSFDLLGQGQLVTAEKGLKRVKIYQPDGTLESVVAAPALFEGADPAGRRDLMAAQRGKLDVAVSPDGTIHVLDPISGLIWPMRRKATDV